MKIPVLMGALMALSVGPTLAMGWRGSSEPQIKSVFDQPYEIRKEKPFGGIILRIDPPPCVEGVLPSYHVLLQMENEVVEVHLGPCGYVENLKPELKVGDSIVGLGVDSAAPSGPRRVLIARELRKGKEVLRFRNSAGKALWEK